MDNLRGAQATKGTKLNKIIDIARGYTMLVLGALVMSSLFGAMGCGGNPGDTYVTINLPPAPAEQVGDGGAQQLDAATTDAVTATDSQADVPSVDVQQDAGSDAVDGSDANDAQAEAAVPECRRDSECGQSNTACMYFGCLGGPNGENAKCYETRDTCGAVSAETSDKLGIAPNQTVLAGVSPLLQIVSYSCTMQDWGPTNNAVTWIDLHLNGTTSARTVHVTIEQGIQVGIAAISPNDGVVRIPISADSITCDSAHPSMQFYVTVDTDGMSPGQTVQLSIDTIAYRSSWTPAGSKADTVRSGIYTTPSPVYTIASPNTGSDVMVVQDAAYPSSTHTAAVEDVLGAYVIMLSNDGNVATGNMIEITDCSFGFSGSAATIEGRSVKVMKGTTVVCNTTVVNGSVSCPTFAHAFLYEGGGEAYTLRVDTSGLGTGMTIATSVQVSYTTYFTGMAVQFGTKSAQLQTTFY